MAWYSKKIVCYVPKIAFYVQKWPNKARKWPNSLWKWPVLPKYGLIWGVNVFRAQKIGALKLRAKKWPALPKSQHLGSGLWLLQKKNLTFGNMGNEGKAVLKHVANLIAVKRGERYADVMGNLTINIRMTLLRCIFLSVRGSRGTSKGTRKPLSSVAFNLIPSGSEQHCLLWRYYK